MSPANPTTPYALRSTQYRKNRSIMDSLRQHAVRGMAYYRCETARHFEAVLSVAREDLLTCLVKTPNHQYAAIDRGCWLAFSLNLDDARALLDPRP